MPETPSREGLPPQLQRLQELRARYTTEIPKYDEEIELIRTDSERSPDAEKRMSDLIKEREEARAVMGNEARVLAIELFSKFASSEWSSQVPKTGRGESSTTTLYTTELGEGYVLRLNRTLLPRKKDAQEEKWMLSITSSTQGFPSSLMSFHSTTNEATVHTITPPEFEKTSTFILSSAVRNFRKNLK